MNRREFIDEAADAGFSREQAEFMWDHLARIGHKHEIEDVKNLDIELELLEEDER